MTLFKSLNMYKFMPKTAYLLLFLMIFFAGLTASVYTKFSQKPRFSALNLEKEINFELGDLVFRLGDELDSLLISRLSEFKYSHIAIVIQTNPALLLHATTNDKKEQANQVIISSFDEFLSHALDFGVARMEFLDKNEKLLLTNALKKRASEPFVLAKKGEKNLYCTTILEEEISKFGEFSPHYQDVNFAFYGGEYLFPRAFWEYEKVKIIYESKKEQG